MKNEEWIQSMIDQFYRQVSYSGCTAVWVLPKKHWETAQHAVQTLFDRKILVVHSSPSPNYSSLSGHLKTLAEAAQSGEFVLALIDDANCSDFLNLLLQLVGYGGHIRHNQTVFSFDVDTFTIHKDFYISVFVDRLDYDKVLKPNIPPDQLGPVFYLDV